MSEFKFQDSILKLGLGIEACIEKGLPLPAMVLTYSAIEIVGWLASPDESSSRRNFTAWVDAYLLKARPLKCTALDLWGGRCGLVHTLTPYSDWSRRGKARLICLVYGSKRAEDMQEAIELSGIAGRYVAVKVEELYEAWRLGVLHLAEELDGDPVKRERVYAKTTTFFSTIDPELLELAFSRLRQS